MRASADRAVRLRYGAALMLASALGACGARQGALPQAPAALAPAAAGGLAAERTVPAVPAAFAPRPSPTPVSCGSGGLTDC